MYWIIGFFVILIILSLMLFVGLASYVALPRVCTMEVGESYEKEHGFWREYDRLPKEEFTVTGAKGYELAAVYVPAPGESNRYVVISHGYTSCRYGSLKYMHMFRDYGFNCIIYDDRRHGVNKRVPCTMGVLESQDLCAVIDAVYARFGPDIKLGLHGESMGSGMQIMALQYKPKVDFIVNDCGYAVLLDVEKKALREWFHLPGWLVYGADVAAKILYGYAFTDVNPIECLEDNTIPICFIHGAEDDFITPDHSRRMFEKTKGYKEIHLFPGAAHAQSMESNENNYRKIVKEFLEKIGEI